MVSVSVCSCFGHFLSHLYKQTQQQQQQQHHHLAESASGIAEQSSRTTTGEWVQGLPDRHLMQPARIVGLDPGRRALFTAVVHSQQVSIYAAPSAELNSLLQTELTDPFAACFWRYPDHHEP